MNFVAILLTLPVLALARIEITITASDDKSQQKLDISGINEDIINDQEIQAFQLTDETLKAAVTAYFGAKPDDVFLKSPTPWGDLYTTYHWKQVSRILKPIKVKILSLNFNPYLVRTDVFNNTSSKPASVTAKMWQTVEDTVSSSWNRSREISTTQEIKYGFDIKAMAVSGNATFAFNARWGESFVKSQKVTVGSETGLEIVFQPNQALIAELYATRGSMSVQVDYVASLYGLVAVNYEEGYKDHHFWSIDINKVLDAGSLDKTVPSTEVIDFGFYVSSKVDLRDIDTQKVLSSLPLTVF